MPEATNRPRRQSFKSHRQRKEMRFGAYTLGSTLGEGEFGKVIMGWRRDDKQPSQVAIKFIRRDTIPKGSERESKVRREINALKNLSHPNIIRLEDVCQNDKYIGIVLDYVSGGELFDYILQNRYLKDSLACRLFAQLVSGVYYMHSKGLVHRDLKLENLLLDKHKNIIITDFGFVNEFSRSNELMKTSCGSPCYAAPELVISNEPYEARKADVWSCGVILYAMLSGYLPFDDDPQNPDGDNISRLYQYITSTNLTFPEYVEPVPRDLLRRILVSNPKRRINLRDVRSHQWLAPHVPFLSITPSEWDANNNSNKAKPAQTRSSSIPKNEYRRYSLIDTSTHHQTPNALPPQTSSNHAIVLPVSASSTSINELAIRQNPRAGHQRSNSVQSSASMALQAVVDANEFRVQQKQQHDLSSSMTSSSSLYGLDKASRAGELSISPPGTHHQQLHQHQGIPRSTTHTGITNLKDNIPTKQQLTNYTIEESPVKQGGNLQINTDGFIKPKVPINSNGFSNPMNQKLPGPGARKPRPTSFYPGLYSSSTPNQPDYNNSNSSVLHMPSPFGRSESMNSIASLSNANNISQPSVELASVEGDIITPKSPNLISPKLYHSPEKDLTPVEGDEKQINENENKDRGQLDPSVNLEGSNSQKKSNRYSAVIAAELVIDKIFGSSLSGIALDPFDYDKSKENLAVPQQPDNASAHSNTASNISTNTGRKTSTAEQRKPKKASSIRIPSNNSTINPTVSNKTKRFSFLSFYNGSSSSSYQQPNDETSLPKTTKKKVLEPSTEVNIVNSSKRNISRNDKNKEPVITYTSFDQKKEPSTAKKVMDFFKRRSMRVG